VDPWLIVGIVILALVVAWLILALIVWANRPPLDRVLPVLPLVPQVTSLVRATREEPGLSGGDRLALRAMHAYLRSPVDLLPDLLPGIGSIDDLVLTGVVLRRVARRIGTTGIRGRWPGSEAEFDLLARLARI
jgi:uncharacterized membrane protein YkvA (DUF1232 family)